MTWDFERVAGPYGFTEGPVWSGERILFSDIPNSRVLAYDPSIDSCTIYRTGTNHANGLKYGHDGGLFACEVSGRRVVRYHDDGATTIIADEYDGVSLNSPNDLAFDDTGRLWFTDPRYPNNAAGLSSDTELGHESVYRVDPTASGWSIARVTYDTTKPNGILISPDQKQLYVAQSDPEEGRPSELRSYPIRQDGSVGEFTVLHDFAPHRGIDGMCLDKKGRIIATAGSEESGPGPMLYVFSSEGDVLDRHPFPGFPTNCAFGGEDLRTLYVTGDDSLFRTRTDMVGYLDAP